MPLHIFSRLLAIAVAVATGACQIIGPATIQHGRANYNDVIQKTSAQQVLENLVRVSQGETPLFIDVAEVDSQILFNTALTGGQSGIGSKSGEGASGAVSGVSTSGSVAATIQYEEQPIIRYTPLQGQALIQQVANPISVDAVANLAVNDWPMLTGLYFTVNRLTPNYADYFSALHAIADL
jgi:hypothetical protein